MKWNKIVKFFKSSRVTEATELSDPITLRLPMRLLEEVTNQSREIGGERYRSKHLVELINIGATYYRIQSDSVEQLPFEQVNLITRLHCVFNKLDLVVEKVAETLGHEDCLKVSGWLSGTIMPSYADLGHFAKAYFINTEWLKFGSLEKDEAEFTPFIVERKAFHEWRTVLKDILSDFNGRKVSFIQLIRSDKGSLAISIEYGNSSFVRSIYYSNIRLRSKNDVGSGGKSDLVNLAMLCYVLYTHIHNTGPIISYSISEEEFGLLIDGVELPFDLGVCGQSKANVWYEMIFDRNDTQNNTSTPCWNGSTILFRDLQDSEQLQKYKEEFLKDPRGELEDLLGGF